MSRIWISGSRVALVAILLFSGLIAGCSTGWKPDQSSAGNKGSYSQTPDGYYRVRRGDSLHAIAFKFGLDWRDIARLNGIKPPYTIYPDQQLRLGSAGTPASQQQSTASTRAGDGSEPPGNRTVITAAPSKSSSSTTVDVPPGPKTPPAATTAAPPPVKTSPTPAVGDPRHWLWPAEGRIISNFRPNDPARKGIDIGGKEGQAIVASAAGEVVYSGSGLIGYGELVIIKHSESLLSAYAHNKKRLVTEGQKVSAGERIAEMGRNDRNQAMLHFEIRLNGNPQDPLKYLPGR